MRMSVYALSRVIPARTGATLPEMRLFTAGYDDQPQLPIHIGSYVIERVKERTPECLPVPDTVIWE